ncbi:MAG: aminotransferase class V-fold PLP-dependent enzyme [Candidatus Acidiferrales bacterium]
MTQILRALRMALPSNGHAEECLKSVAARFQVKYVFGVSSGRAALWLILRSLQRLQPERNVVALPAYTCFSVPASVVRAGLKLYPVEIDPHTLDFDLSQLEALPDKRLLCVVTSNLFGFVNDLPRIRQVAKAKGAFVLDDAAQALGAIRNGQFAGTLGDVGVFSLDRGKAVAAMEGGLIVTNSEEIARIVQAEAKNLNTPSSIHGAWLLLEMLVYSVLLSPRLYWIPNSMPFLKLGVTEFDPAFRTEKLHSLCRGLLPQLLDGLPKVNQVRRANAKAITEALAGSSDFHFPRPALNTHPTFVRLPVVARDNVTRERAVSRLRGAGIGAGSFYPSAVCDIAGIEPYMSVGDFHRKHAELLSQRLLTLPVSPLVRPQDVERMVDILTTL